MKKYNKYIGLLVISLAFTSCDNEVYPEITKEIQPKVALKAEGLNFSNYVAIGASFTSGFSDGALFKAGQESSFPNILASKFAMTGGGEFTQPLMNDNIGGLLFAGNKIQDPRLYFNGKAPSRLDATPTTEVTSKTTTTGNFGVPGVKSFHLVASGYGNPQGVPIGRANPYFARFASSPTTSILTDVLTQNPTFFTLSEIGGNDVLGYAISGGTGVDQSPTTTNPTGNLDPATYGGSDITNPLVFKNVYTQIVDALVGSNERKGVVTTVPYITSLPFFTTVANNTLELDAEKATQLTGVFGAVSKLFIGGLIARGVPAEQAQALGAQYAITFNEGKNRWIIDVPVTRTNPLGFRQMTENELLLLTIDRNALKTQGYGTIALTPEVMTVLAKLQQGGTPTPEEATMVINAVNGIDDKDALDSDELNSIKTATDAYNTIIKEVAQAKKLALVDLKAILEKASTTGITFDEYNMTTNFATGGLISLDGIHLTSRGYAFMANEMLKAIDAKYNSNFTKATNGLAKAADYPTNYSPSLR